MSHPFLQLLVAAILTQAAAIVPAQAVDFSNDPSLFPLGGQSASPDATAEHPAREPVPAVKRLDKADTEREQLANLSQELTYLRHQVAEASTKAPGAARVQFRYDWLDRDLELIQRGIQEHLDAPRQPRPIAPLKGAYRR